MFVSSLLHVCISGFIDHKGYKDEFEENVNNPAQASYKSDSYEYQSEDIRSMSQLKRSALRAMYEQFVRRSRGEGRCHILHYSVNIYYSILTHFRVKFDSKLF